MPHDDKNKRAQALDIIGEQLRANPIQDDSASTYIDDAALGAIRSANDTVDRASGNRINKIGSALRRFAYIEPGIKELDAVKRRLEAQNAVTHASKELVNTTIDHRATLADYHGQTLTLGGEVLRVANAYRKRQLIAELQANDEIAAAQTQLVQNRRERDALALGYDPHLRASEFIDRAAANEAEVLYQETEQQRTAQNAPHNGAPAGNTTDVVLQVLRREEKEAMLANDPDRLAKAQQALAPYTPSVAPMANKKMR